MTGVNDFVVSFNEVTSQVYVESCVEPFCHDIGYVFLGGNIFDCKTVVLLDLVLDPVVLDVHIVGTFEVHDGPVCDMDHGLVITQYELLVW